MLNVLAVIALLFSGAFLYQDPAADQLIRHCLQSVYNLHFQEARADALALQQKYPTHPAGFTMYAETFWWEAQTDPGNKSIEDAYYVAQKVGVAKAEKALKSPEYSNIEILAYLASAYGSYARFQVTQKGAYFSALRAGLKAHDYADQVFNLDRQYYDIYVGVGAFNYFSGSLPAVIKPFAFLFGARGDRDLGIDQLKTAMTRARYSQTEAQIVYFTAMLEDKNYPQAFETVEKLMSEYPDNFIFYSWVTNLYRQQGKNSDGAAYFDKLANAKRQKSPLMAKYALLEKAQLQNADNHKAEARQTIDQIKSIPAVNLVFEKKLAGVEKTIRK